MHRFINNLLPRGFVHQTPSKRTKKPLRTRLQLESLERREVLSTDFRNGVLSIAGTNFNDVIELRSPTPGETQVIVNNVTEFNGSVTNLTQITIDGQGGDGDKVFIYGVQSGVTGGAVVNNAEDVVLGDSGTPQAEQIDGLFTLANIRSAVAVFGTVNGSLSILDGGDPTPKSVGVSSNRVNGLGSVPDVLFNLPASPLGRLNLATGDGNDTITVSSTPQIGAHGVTIASHGGADTFKVFADNSVLRLNGGSGNDVFKLSSTDFSLGLLANSVIIDGGTDSNSLVVDDRGRDLTQTVYTSTLSTDVSGNALQVNALNIQSGQTDRTRVNYVGIQSVSFKAPLATTGEEIDVQSTASDVNTVIDSGGAALVKLGNAGSLNGIQGAVTINRATVGGQIVLDDSAQPNAQTYFLNAGNVGRFDMATVSFDNNTSDVRVKAGSANDTFFAHALRGSAIDTSIANVLRRRVPATYHVEGGSGSDVLFAPNTTNLWELTGANAGKLNKTILFSFMENLVGGTGDDQFKLANGAFVTGSISGVGLGINGDDTLDYSLYTTPVSVNLAQGSATNVGGGAAGKLSGIRAVFGGRAGDRLTGDSGNNVILGLGGRDVIVGGGGKDILIGGAGADDISNDNSETIFAGGDTVASITTPAAMKALLAEWVRPDATYQQRVDHIRNGGGLNGTVKLNASTLTNDSGAADIIRAGSALDLIFLNSEDLLSGNPAQNPSEIVNL
jgi:hypothetical protein